MPRVSCNELVHSEPGPIMVAMNYTATYQDPWNRNGISKEGTVVTYTVKLLIASNTALTDEQARETLRHYLRERLKLTDIDEQKIRIE
jgi:hypothetical protein